MEPTTQARRQWAMEPGLRGTEPTTEAGKRALSAVREVVVYDTRDRFQGGYALAWYVRDEVVKAEAEAREQGAREERDRIVKVMGERYWDLRWCNKDDHCDERADSIAVVLADLGIPIPDSHP